MKNTLYLTLIGLGIFLSCSTFAQQTNNKTILSCGFLRNDQGNAPSERTNPMVVIEKDHNYLQFSKMPGYTVTTVQLNLVGTVLDFEIFEAAGYIVKIATPEITPVRPYRVAWVYLKNTDYHARCLVGGDVSDKY